MSQTNHLGPDDEALPVALACSPQRAQELRGHLEAVLGWQVIDSVDAVWMRPALVVADGDVGIDDALAGVPTILVVGREDDATEIVRRARSVGAQGACCWPEERQRLAELARIARTAPSSDTRRALSVGVWRDHALRPAPRLAQDEASSLVVAGSAGGVGTTTVALALGGLAGWGGRPTLALVRGDVPVPDVPTVEADGVGGPGLWTRARPAPGVPRLRVARVAGEVVAVDRVGPPVAGALLVVDAGVDLASATVLVVRRDRAGLEALGRSPAGGVVLVDDGPVPEQELLRAVRVGTVVVLPRSHRVARAGVERTVPARLPGAWLAPLRCLLPDQPVPLPTGSPTR